jgi:ankyrin repeat protein
MASKANRRNSEIALHYAIRNGRPEEVSRLLKEGVGPNALGDEPLHPKLAQTTLCSAVSTAGDAIRRADILTEDAIRELGIAPAERPKRKRKASLEIIRLLLVAGADPNQRMLTRTPLSLAVHNGDYEVTQLLLEAGASPSGECWSPLPEKAHGKWAVAPWAHAIHEAAEKGYTAIVKMLCKHGADISVHDHSGHTPLQIAQDPATMRILKRYEKKAVRNKRG